MCICDDKYFKVTNIATGKIKLYKRAISIANRFDSNRDLIFHYLNRKGIFYLSLKEERYKVEANKHPECEEARKDIIQRYGVRLGKIPDRYRYLLPEHRQ